MLYIFLVDTGTMLTFDINLALESVANLKASIARQCHIPEDKQVLLISGGESLNLTSRVCSYSAAGTDTSPIFLFSKNAIESAIPPNCVTDYGPDHDMRERVESCIDMNPNYNTVVARAEMAQTLFEMAKQQLNICERLVHDQHLQQQGWAAVVANLEDIAFSFSNTAAQLEDTYHTFADKSVYVELLQNFNNDLSLLDKIPILPVLVDQQTNDENSDNKIANSLLEWISQKDTQSSLEQIAEQCSRGLDQIDYVNFIKIKEEVKDVLESCNCTHMKEVKGLEERLYGLEKLMCDAKKAVDDQRDLAQAFYQNQTRASNLRDASILPDLCASHQQQLQVMLQNHHKLRDVRRKCSRAKEELSTNLHVRLRWIMFVEKKLSDVDAKILIYRENLRRVKKHLELVHQIHLAPKIYLKSVVEVVRRKTFSDIFSKWATSLSQQSSNLINHEISLRQNFFSEFDAHFLQILFPGMNDYPPRFASEPPFSFDLNLPNLCTTDIEYLKNKLPDLSDLLLLPLPVPMPYPSIDHYQNKEPHCAQNNVKTRTCESDNEEFENVTNELPKWQESDTDPSSPINDIESPQNNHELDLSNYNDKADFISGDFIIEDIINTNLKDGFSSTSLTMFEINNLETQFETYYRQLNDKCGELLVIQKDNEKNSSDLNSAKNLITNILQISSNLFYINKEFRNTFCLHFKHFSTEYLSSLISVKEQLINMVLHRENVWNSQQTSLNSAILQKESEIEELKNRMHLLQSELSSLKDVSNNDKKYIECLIEEVNNKDNDLFNMKQQNEEKFKRMTLEHELEMVSQKEESDKLNNLTHELRSVINEKNNEIEILRRENEKLETNLLIRFQEEKNSLIDAMNQNLCESQQLIRNECEEKMKQMERNNEAIMNEMRVQHEQEKAKSLIELKDQLSHSHKNELESLRYRYKLAISTTSIERTPSESSLEKVQLDVVDQLVQEKEINRLKQIILEEKEKYESIIFKLKKEKEDEMKILRSTYQAERQVRFNEAICKLSNEKDLLLQQIRKRDHTLQSISTIIPNLIINESQKTQIHSDILSVFNQISDEINLLISNIGKPSESETDNFELCRCDSNKLLKEKETEVLKLRQALCDQEMAHSSSTVGQIERIAILSCDVGDIVLVYYDERTRNYVVFSLCPILHFLHTESVNSLFMSTGTGDARQRWTLAEVTDKEYCQARKEQNRYYVPINTKFYRVKARQWSRMIASVNRSPETPIFSATTTFAANEPMAAMDMSSSTIEVDSNNTSIIKN